MNWFVWMGVGLAVWLTVALGVGMVVGRIIRRRNEQRPCAVHGHERAVTPPDRLSGYAGTPAQH